MTLKEKIKNDLMDDINIDNFIEKNYQGKKFYKMSNYFLSTYIIGSELRDVRELGIDFENRLAVDRDYKVIGIFGDDSDTRGYVFIDDLNCWKQALVSLDAGEIAPFIIDEG